jgi:hypothetical protein
MGCQEEKRILGGPVVELAAAKPFLFFFPVGYRFWIKEIHL